MQCIIPLLIYTCFFSLPTMKRQPIFTLDCKLSNLSFNRFCNARENEKKIKLVIFFVFCDSYHYVKVKMHLYTDVRLSVRPSVRPSVHTAYDNSSSRTVTCLTIAQAWCGQIWRKLYTTSGLMKVRYNLIFTFIAAQLLDFIR